MPPHRLALALLLTAGLARTAAAQPSLVAAPDRGVAVTHASGARTFHLASAILRETRPVHVVLPPSYARSAPGRRYPVIVVLDGESSVPAATAAAYELSGNGQIPEALIVAIPNLDPLRGRVHDLTPPGLSVSGSSLSEGGDRFLDFIERELLPAVDRQLRGGEPRTLVGHSSGAVLATYAAATRPAFRAVVAIDAPAGLGDDWLPKQLAARAARPGAPVRYVSLEARFGWSDAAWRSLVAAAPASWLLYRERLRLESHESAPMLGMYLGLREAFRDYSALAAPEAPTTGILPYYDRVGEALGARIVPPRRVLAQVSEDLAAEGRGAAARAAYQALAAAYGAPEDSARRLAEIAAAERRPPPAETVEGLLATPFATPDEARPFVGEWVGDVVMGPDQPRTNAVRLRVRVAGGRVVGETVRTGPDGAEVVRAWEYLRVTPAGLTWGIMNGMRPRAVVLFEGVLQGDTLAGRTRFGGVELPPGEGTSLYFSFTRVRG